MHECLVLISRGVAWGKYDRRLSGKFRVYVSNQLDLYDDVFLLFSKAQAFRFFRSLFKVSRKSSKWSQK